jgi:hypothetical protein
MWQASVPPLRQGIDLPDEKMTSMASSQHIWQKKKVIWWFVVLLSFLLNFDIIFLLIFTNFNGTWFTIIIYLPFFYVFLNCLNLFGAENPDSSFLRPTRRGLYICVTYVTAKNSLRYAAIKFESTNYYTNYTSIFLNNYYTPVNSESKFAACRSM